jgi:integrase
MARREHLQGSIKKRKDGRWEVRLSIRGDDGKLKRPSFYCKSEYSAHFKLKTLLKKYAQSNNAETPRFDEFTRTWLEHIKANRAVATYKLYSGTIRRHVCPLVIKPSLRLNELKVQHFDDLMRSLTPRRLAGPDGIELHGVPVATRRKTLQILRQMLNYAVRKDLLTTNVANKADMPKPARKPKRVLLSQEQARILLHEARKTTRFYELFLLALSTAMREGELFALQFCDFDPVNKSIRVEGNITESYTGEMARTDPKTEASKRTIDLPEDVSAAIAEMQRCRDAKPSDLMFSDSEGKPLRKSNFLRRVYHPLLERAGLPKVTFHSLRHVSNSILYSKTGNVKTLQERLGHTTARITLETYTHVLSGAHREAADALTGLFTDEELTP